MAFKSVILYQAAHCTGAVTTELSFTNGMKRNYKFPLVISYLQATANAEVSVSN